MEIKDLLRTIPSIDKLAAEMERQAAMPDTTPRRLKIMALREAVERIRVKIKAGLISEVALTEIIAEARTLLAATVSPKLKQTINATGVILHTNLGRAPLSRRARERIADVAGGYSTLEYDLETGRRGSRYSHIAKYICSLTGAEDAIAVNNNAAAILLVLSAVAAGREVIVSRGQLVEIGGSFRIPDVLRQSGATLVEVGTTNRTRLSDYKQALSANTGAILKVHTSNYRIVGFAEQPDDRQLADLAGQYGVPIIDDLGSGTLLPITAGDWHEPTVRERIAAGMDIVTFSGDKLLGAGQAGLIAGRKKYLEMIKQHPLLRAVRIDKLSLAALEGTLLDYIAGSPLADIPVLAMLHADENKLRNKAEKLAEMLEKALAAYSWEIKVKQILSQAGGGSLPGVEFISWGVTVKCSKLSAAKLEQLLRSGSIPIIARIQEDNIVFDIRCLTDSDFAVIAAGCLAIAKGAAQ